MKFRKAGLIWPDGILMIRKALKILLCAILCLGIVGCAAKPVNVTYTVYPVGYLVKRISGNNIPCQSIQNETIVQRATIVENYKNILENSSLFIHIGDLEPYMTVYGDEINKMESLTKLDLSGVNAVYNFQRYTPVVNDGVVTYIEGPYYNDEAFDSVDIDQKDLYLWTDPIAMLSMAKNIREELIKQDPENQTYYEENCERLIEDLVSLDASYQSFATKLQNSGQNIKFVSMSASFGNWQKTYGIQVYPVVLSKYGVLPNSQQLEVIKKRIVNDGVKYIIYEPNMTDDMIELFNELQKELGLVRVELSNLSSLTPSQIESGKDYISIMYENLSVLETMVSTNSTTATDNAEE